MVNCRQGLCCLFDLFADVIVVGLGSSIEVFVARSWW